MKYKQFDVVELNNGCKATVLKVNKNECLVEMVDSRGMTIGSQTITDEDIKQVLLSK